MTGYREKKSPVPWLPGPVRKIPLKSRGNNVIPRDLVPRLKTGPGEGPGNFVRGGVTSCVLLRKYTADDDIQCAAASSLTQALGVNADPHPSEPLIATERRAMMYYHIGVPSSGRKHLPVWAGGVPQLRLTNRPKCCWNIHCFYATCSI